MKAMCPFCRMPFVTGERAVNYNGLLIHQECAEEFASNLPSSEVAFKKEQVDAKIPSPKETKAYLDQYVIGQDEAKKTLSVALYEHLKRAHGITKTEKSNVLMVGPTGTGKTLLAKTLAKMLDVPFVMADATTLTESGYVGDDVECIISRLLAAAGGDASKAEKGIVCIDEIDKLAAKHATANTSKDVSGQGVQQALLKMLEGSVVEVSADGRGKKHPMQKGVEVNTSNILFICCGAFPGLKEIAEKRQEQKAIGFCAVKEKTESEIMQDLSPDDFIKFGMLPEFMGRLPIHTYLEDMTEDTLIRILTEPKDCIVEQIRSSCDSEHVPLVVEDGALRAIAQKALKEKTGARGLRTILEDAMRDVYFEFPVKEKEVHIRTSGDGIEAILEDFALTAF